jgi:hypothetical protein
MAETYPMLKSPSVASRVNGEPVQPGEIQCCSHKLRYPKTSEHRIEFAKLLRHFRNRDGIAPARLWWRNFCDRFGVSSLSSASREIETFGPTGKNNRWKGGTP